MAFWLVSGDSSNMYPETQNVDFLTDYFQNSLKKKKLSDFKSLEVCNSFYLFQAV